MKFLSERQNAKDPKRLGRAGTSKRARGTVLFAYFFLVLDDIMILTLILRSKIWQDKQEK